MIFFSLWLPFKQCLQRPQNNYTKLYYLQYNTIHLANGCECDVGEDDDYDDYDDGGYVIDDHLDYSDGGSSCRMLVTFPVD